MVIGMAEFLEKVAKMKKIDEKVKALQENDTLALRIVLQGAFDPNVVWLLPKDDPPYTENTLVDQEHVFHRESEKVKYFIQGFYPEMKQIKREQMFIEFLERLDANDAKLLCAIKNKKLPFSGLAATTVKKAFPDLIVQPENNYDE